MTTRTDEYQQLFGKEHIRDGSVVESAEHGRSGGLSTGQGFKFTSGIDEALQYAKDSSNSKISYVGEASVGAQTSAASWKIQQIDTTNGVSIKFASGNNNYEHIWDDRESLSYE